MGTIKKEENIVLQERLLSGVAGYAYKRTTPAFAGAVFLLNIVPGAEVSDLASPKLREGRHNRCWGESLLPVKKSR